MEGTSVAGASVVEKKDGKHLIFQLEERGYGIPILTVNEIIGIMDITPVPKAPHFIKGIINLRGKIIPVMDLRLKFGMVEKEHTAETCIIIVNIHVDNTIRQMGIVVDIVSEVFDILASDIEEPPKYGNQMELDFLNGIGKVKDKVVMLLDIEKVIYSDDVVDFLSEKKDFSAAKGAKNGLD